MPYQKRTLIDRIRCRLFTDFSRETPYSFSQVKSYIEKKDFDKVIIENTPWQFPYFVKKFGNKVYLHLHNDWVNESFARGYKKKMEKAINNSGGVLVVSEYIKKRVCTLEIKDINKIKVFYNATDLNKYSKRAEEIEKYQLREKLNIEKDDIVIIYSGRVCKDKGVLELVKAFKNIRRLGIKLLLVGSVSYGETTTDEYTKQVEEEINNIRDYVVETGFVPYDQMYKYYSIADIQVIPSMWEEPFGLVALEGMAQKLPIICTNSGGLAEILKSENAIIINRKNVVEELSSALELLINNKDMRIKMGNAAYKEIVNNKYYDLEQYYRGFIKLIN
jgi:glycosyltransferase involved in cell wall biosynthesis